MRKTIHFLTMIICVTAFVSEAVGGECRVDGDAFSSTSTLPVRTSTNGNFAGNVCGHTIYGPNGNCFLLINSDDDAASGDCLTVGKGVNITTDGNSTLTCTSNLCGDAINKSGSGSGNVTIDGLHVVGPWLVGIETITTSDTYSNSLIDLTGDCWTLNTGITGTPNLIDGVKIIGGNQIGAGLATYCASTAGTIKNSIMQNCRKALRPTYQSVVDNCVFWGNDTALDGDSANGDMKGSHFVGNTCDCKVSGVCQPISECMDLETPSFTEDNFAE
jgi:hypothetical protein